MIANTSTPWQTSSLGSDSIGLSLSELATRKARGQTHTKEWNTSITSNKAPWLEVHLISTVEQAPRRRSINPVTTVSKMRTRLEQLNAVSSQQIQPICAKYRQDVLRIAVAWAGHPCTAFHSPASTPITAVELTNSAWCLRRKRPPASIQPPSRTANCPRYLR